MGDDKDIRDKVTETHAVVIRIERSITALETITDKHTEQIAFWRGGLALVGFILLVFGALFFQHLSAAGK